MSTITIVEGCDCTFSLAECCVCFCEGPEPVQTQGIEVSGVCLDIFKLKKRREKTPSISYSIRRFTARITFHTKVPSSTK